MFVEVRDVIAPVLLFSFSNFQATIIFIVRTKIYLDLKITNENTSNVKDLIYAWAYSKKFALINSLCCVMEDSMFSYGCDCCMRKANCLNSMSCQE